MIRLYKNLKRSPWNKEVDNMGTKSMFHTSRNINPKINMYPNSNIQNSIAFHFNNYSVLLETKQDVQGLIRVLQESIKDMD